MKNMGNDVAQQQCIQFLDALRRPAFVVVGWKKDDNTLEVIQSIKEMNPVEYMKAMSWAVNEVGKEL